MQQRAAGDSSVAPADLLSSARHRGATLYRRQVAGGTLVALLFAGGLVGAVVANHGRATVGVSVAGPTGTTEDPTTSWTGPTTTVGNGGMHTIVPCPDWFFGQTMQATLEAHFGTMLNCDLVANTWMVTFTGSGGATTAALLRCRPDDRACLDPATMRDFDSFRVVYIPPVDASNTGASVTTYVAGDGQAPTIVATIGFPRLPPTTSPLPSIRITGPADSTELSVQLGSTCEPLSGPATTNWGGSLSTISGRDALRQPVPDPWQGAHLWPSSC